MADPVAMPFIRLVPVEGRMWTGEDYEAVCRILQYIRDAHMSAAAAKNVRPAESTYARRLGVAELASARWELDRLLDRIAVVDMGVQHSDL